MCTRLTQLYSCVTRVHTLYISLLLLLLLCSRRGLILQPATGPYPEPYEWVKRPLKMSRPTVRNKDILLRLLHICKLHIDPVPDSHEHTVCPLQWQSVDVSGHNRPMLWESYNPQAKRCVGNTHCFKVKNQDINSKMKYQPYHFTFLDKIDRCVNGRTTVKTPVLRLPQLSNDGHN